MLYKTWNLIGEDGSVTESKGTTTRRQEAPEAL